MWRRRSGCEDLKIASLLHWLASLLVWQGWLLGSQGMLHGVSGGITERVGGMLGKSCLDRSVEEGEATAGGLL